MEAHINLSPGPKKGLVSTAPTPYPQVLRLLSHEQVFEGGKQPDRGFWGPRTGGEGITDVTVHHKVISRQN